jgi:hypothetical protein
VVARDSEALGGGFLTYEGRKQLSPCPNLLAAGQDWKAMMREIGTMAIWNRHLLSRHRQGAILLGASLAFVPVASTADKEIAHHRPKH